MASGEMKIPGPDHPITVEPAPYRVRATFAGVVIADSMKALVLKEARYPRVYYFPREDVRMDLLARSTHTSWCPYKGEASYFSINSGNAGADNAVWSYETPFDAVAPIRERLAFYADRVKFVEGN